MNPTKEEILDLAESLSDLGVSNRNASFGLPCPEGFRKERPHSFSSTVIREHGKELSEMGLTLKESMMGWAINGGPITPTNLLTIQGPWAKAYKQALRIGEMYNCDQLIEFVE